MILLYGKNDHRARGAVFFDKLLHWQDAVLQSVCHVEKAEAVFKANYIMDYKTSSNGEIKIFENVKINKVVVALDAAKVNILSINSSDESVEDYYLNLIRRVD